jgi:hypothetical protein
MIDILNTIERLVENEIIRTVFTYYIISIVLWLSFFLVSDKMIKSRAQLHSKTYHKSEFLLCFSVVIFLLFLLVRAMDYVGYLPYGQDTAEYTYYVKNIPMNGYWRGHEGYYSLYHVSAVFLTIFTEILGSVEVAYFFLLIAFLLSLTFSLGITISKISRTSIRLCISLVVLLFIATPYLGGFDLHQQYVGVVYATLGVSVLLSSRTRERVILFLTFIIMSVIAHLTSVLVSLMLLAMHITSSKKSKGYKEDFITFVCIAVAYLFFSQNPDNILMSLYNSLTSLLQGTVGEYTIRALTEVSASKIFLFSWVLLPSIASAYLLMQVAEKITHKVMKASIFEEDINKFILITYSFSLGLIFLGVLSGLTVYLVRYFALPSYATLLFSVSVMLSRLIKSYGRRQVCAIVLLFLLAPYIYSAVNSSERSPWIGEPRLAPKTRIDRMEMRILAQYGADGYYLYGWHDSYIPYEEAGREIFLQGGGSYYPIHDVLTKMAKGERVDVPVNSYLVPLKNVLSSRSYENYNVVYDGYQHVIMVLE